MIKEKIEKLIKEAIDKAELGDIKEIIVVPSQDQKFGDYSSPVSFVIGRKFKKNPAEIARILQKNLKADFLDKVEIVDSYLNFFLSNKFLNKNISDICAEKENYGKGSWGDGRTMIIDYSSPNIAKSFGIGHLRSTIIGQAIYNLYKFGGWKCIGENHLGDWGTQFGKLIYKIKEKGIDPEVLSIQKLEELYIEFHKDAEANPKLKEVAKEYFNKLENGDEEILNIWKTCRGISIKEFDRIYKLLDVKIDNAHGESFYSKDAPKIIEQAIKNNIGRKSDGAYIIEFEDETVQVLRKSDGSTTYLARDLAAVKHRAMADMIVYEVGSDQKLYFKQVFEVAKKMNLAPNTELVYVGHGLIRSKEGKFSTRGGNTIHLEDVLDEAIKRADELVKDETLAQDVGISAVKYSGLVQHHSQDIIFDWDKVMSLKGNSGPYIQYTYARCCSLLDKAGWKGYKNTEAADFNEYERRITSYLTQFPDVLQTSAREFSPNILCNYVFELSQLFNSFYDKVPIAVETDKELKLARLNLVYAVGQVIESSLDILGIKHPQRM